MKLAALILLVFVPFTINSAIADPSHLGQPYSEHVTLKFSYDDSDRCFDNRAFFRVNLDGSIATSPYTVPGNKVLIITDVIWKIVHQPGDFILGSAAGISLNSHRGRDGAFIGEIYDSEPVTITNEHITSGIVGNADHIVAGARVGPWKLICAIASSLRDTGGSGHSVRSAWIYGYEISK